jgi:hypothetical protein
VRRTVATLLVVTSPLLLATPVSASDDRFPAPASAPAATPIAPAPVQAATAAVPAPAPVTAIAPAVPAPALTPPAAPRPVHHAVKAVRPTAPAGVTDLNDTAYATRLQAELCQARQIFCGLDRSGRYPAS